LTYLGLGANLGDRIQNIQRAIEKIVRHPRIELFKKSAFYETKPWGIKNQPDFINTVIEIKTSLPPLNLFKFLKQIERKLGREKRTRWGPREIDIDILLYGNLVLENCSLKIPHPEMIERDFVLIPLAEIAPDLIHPVVQKTIRDLVRIKRFSPLKRIDK
jgi:2-amino-4-hydroxy-6-hydroxymethyldihydropteridine diphosphokinase